MRHFAAQIALVLAVLLTSFSAVAAQSFGSTGISTLDPWAATTTPIAAITQRTYARPIKITGLATGNCLTLTTGSILTTTPCGSGGGGVSTTTSNTWTGTNTFATTTTAALNGTITVSGWPYAQTIQGIQQAVTVCSANPSCSTVLLPDATYSGAGANIRLARDGIGLIGQSKSGTIINGNVDGPVIYTLPATSTATTTAYSRISIQNLSVKQSYSGILAHVILLRNVDSPSIINVHAEDVGTLAGPPEGIYTTYNNNLIMDNVDTFNMTGDSIMVTGSTNFRLSNIYVSSSSDDAIDIDLDFGGTASIGSSNGTLTNINIDGVAIGNGIRVEDSSYVVGSSIRIANVNAGGCITVNQTVLPMVGNNFSGNTLAHCHTNGMIVSGPNVTGTVFNGNTITDTGHNGGSDVEGGIQINSASTTAIGNYISGQVKTGSDAGCLLIYKVSDVNAPGNYLANCQNGVELWNGNGTTVYKNVSVNDQHFSGVTNRYDGAFSQSGVDVTGSYFSAAGNFVGFGIATSTPGTLFSIGGIANFSAGTSTIYTGLNITSGCFSVSGSCIGSATTTSVSNGGTGTTTQITNGINYFDGTKITSNPNLLTDGQRVAVGSGLTSSVGDIAGVRIVSDNYVSRTNGFLSFNQPFQVTGGSGTSTLPSNQGFAIGSSFTYQASTGFVGIGTANPTSLLSVVPGTGDQLSIGQSTSYGGHGGMELAEYYIPNGSKNAAVKLQSNTGSAGAVVLAVANGGGLSEGARLDNTGYFGVGTSTPGSILSVNGVVNLTSGTSTFYSTGGINLTSGCFSVNGTCISNVSYAASYPLLLSGTTFSFAFGTTTSNSWSQFQAFNGGASTTNLTASGTGYFGSVVNGGVSANSLLYANGSKQESAVTVSSATGVSFSAGTLSLSSIPNSSLANSSVTFNGTTIALGSSGTITAASSTLLANNNTFSGTLVLNGATTTATNGLNITAGCIAYSGACLSLSNLNGTLPVSKGGTGTTTWISGSIPFYNGSNLAENNGKLFWDNTNNYLGIGIATPNAPLHVYGVDTLIRLDSLNDTVRAFLRDTYQTFYLGMYNTTGAIYQNVIGMQVSGKVGSVTNTGVSAPIFRNLLDDGSGRMAAGTTTPVASFQAATTSLNATTTIEFGKSGQNKGSCIKLYDVTGAAVYLWVQGGALQVSTTACASVTGF